MGANIPHGLAGLLGGDNLFSEFGSVLLFVCLLLPAFTYFVCLLRLLAPCWLAVLSLLSACARFALAFAAAAASVCPLSLPVLQCALFLCLFGFAGRFQELFLGIVSQHRAFSTALCM